MTAGESSVLTWSVSGATALSIDQGIGAVTGAHRPVSPTATTTYTLTATNSGGSTTASATVHVTPAPPAPVATVTISMASTALTLGQTSQATATPRDSSGNALTGRAISWATGSTAVATVDANGLVTATGIGTTTILATSEGKSGSIDVNVSAEPPPPVATVTVSLVTSSLLVGQTTQASAVARDSSGSVLTGRSVTWSSASTSVATVDPSGLVTATGVGTTLITATSEGKSGSTSVSVSVVPVSAVTVVLGAPSIAVGETTLASATLQDASGNVLAGRSVSWTSSNPGVATVSAAGLVRGVAAGSATITATSEGKAGGASVSVVRPPPTPVASVTVSLASSNLYVGGTTLATVVLRDSAANTLTGRTVTWSTSDDLVATVSAGGLVTAVGVGSAIITATSEGRSGTAVVSVSLVPVATVSVSLASSSLYVGGSTQASAVLRDTSGNTLTGRTVSWSSGSGSVATVSASGLVTAVGVGSAVITATSEGRTGTAIVSVSLVPVSTVTVTLASSSLHVGGTTQASAVLKDASGNTLTGRSVTWSTSNAAIATVGASGLVAGVGSGSVTITATAEGVSSSVPMYVEAAGPGAPTQIVPVSALRQTAAPGQRVLQAPAVVVRDSAGTAVPGVSVSFTVTSGGGTIVGSPATTDANGVARATSWTLGTAGPQSVQATSASMGGISVDFTGLARTTTDRFDVTIWVVTAMTDGQIRAFANAKERIEEIITGDLAAGYLNYTAAQLASCGGTGVTGIVDDVLIVAEATPIDGAGSILGQAGPCAIRVANSLPILGHMMFDSADLSRMETNGTLDSVILHEMLHVLGYGTVWSTLGLVTGSGTASPYFTGATGIDAFLNFNDGGTFAGSPVPVENTGGTGTADSHWRESVFKSELMTGWLSGATQPLSRTTVASLGDLGYVVDVSKADPFSILAALLALGPPDRSEIFVGDDIRPHPPIVVDTEGRPVTQ